MVGIKQVSTKNMPREAWLSLRRKTIGGSDAAAIVGLSKWATPYTVWADKTGRLSDKEESEAMRQGRDLEEYVAKRWCERTGKKVRRVQALLYNPKYPHLHADIDRMVVGEDAGLECKTTSTLDVKQFNGVEFPEQYYCQCLHYLAVTGLKRWHLAVLVFGRGFFTFTLERDEAEIDALVTAEDRFFERYVLTDTPPSTDGKEATTEALQVIYSESKGETINLFGRETILSEYMMLKRQKKAIDERMEEIQNLIKSEMALAERGECGPFSVNWKSQQRRIFQPQEFARAYPEINLERFYKVSFSRPFKVERAEEN